MAFTSLESEFDSENWAASYRQRPTSVKGQNCDKNSQRNDEAWLCFCPSCGTVPIRWTSNKYKEWRLH